MRFLPLISSLCLCASVVSPSVLAVEVEDESAIIKKLEQPEQRDKALAKAVAFLASRQKADGSFGEKYSTAMTGLAVMAMMAVGHTPDDPDYCPAIHRAINYVLSQMREDGYF